MPDLNSLPPSHCNTFSNTQRNMPSPSTSIAEGLRAQSPSPLSRSASTSLQAAAAVNAGLQHDETRRGSSQSSNSISRTSPTTGRRRSAVLMNLQMNNPNAPPAGEIVNENQPSSFRTSRRGSAASPISMFGDPHHGRNPSLGEIHQELESEQEGQVNRLLQQIRQQQAELMFHRSETARLQGLVGVPAQSSSAIDDTPSTQPIGTPAATLTNNPRSPSFSRSSLDAARSDLNRRSRTPSRTTSPRIRHSSVTGDVDPFHIGGRDESAFYQAETAMVTRENQMLKQRIRELERQISEHNSNSSVTHEPLTHSLLRSESSPSNDSNTPLNANTVALPAESAKPE